LVQDACERPYRDEQPHHPAGGRVAEDHRGHRWQRNGLARTPPRSTMDSFDKQSFSKHSTRGPTQAAAAVDAWVPHADYSALQRRRPLPSWEVVAGSGPDLPESVHQ
jgi:hypothetical protein